MLVNVRNKQIDRCVLKHLFRRRQKLHDVGDAVGEDDEDDKGGKVTTRTRSLICL